MVGQRMNTRKYVQFTLVFISIIIIGACAPSTNENTQPSIKMSLSTLPDPPHVGNGQLVIDVADAAGKPMSDLKIDVSMGMNGMNMSTQDGLADAPGQGRYVFAVIFHQLGEYSVQLWVRRNGELLKNEVFKFQIDK